MDSNEEILSTATQKSRDPHLRDRQLRLSARYAFVIWIICGGFLYMYLPEPYSLARTEIIHYVMIAIPITFMFKIIANKIDLLMDKLNDRGS